MKTTPHLKFELGLWEQGMLACGMDEVGRGAFAGPLVVGAVVLKPVETKKDLQWLLSFGVNDSKLVNPKKRKLINELLQEYILFSTVQYISCDIINEVGVGKANKMGFSNAAKDILEKARHCEETEALPYRQAGIPSRIAALSSIARNDKVFFLTDAFEIPDIHVSLQKNIIRGDTTVFSIAAASILAKVHRDEYMEKLGIEFPEYGFAKHKGYGTKIHRDAIKEHGPCPHHRTEFVKNHIFHA